MYTPTYTCTTPPFDAKVENWPFHCRASRPLDRLVRFAVFLFPWLLFSDGVGDKVGLVVVALEVDE